MKFGGINFFNLRIGVSIHISENSEMKFNPPVYRKIYIVSIHISENSEMKLAKYVSFADGDDVSIHISENSEMKFQS